VPDGSWDKHNRLSYLSIYLLDNILGALADTEFLFAGHNQAVEPRERAGVLDRDQLREVTLDDDELMRKILGALVDDSKRQMVLLDAAIREQDATPRKRLAHYSKGACAYVEVRSAAAILKEIESKAAERNFPACGAALARLGPEVDLLDSEAPAL
jgi:HPt (histidine-containing phosphotransfer) domain-containing protein